MNILYIAYSCAPNKGSEEKIGWNVPLESAKSNHVFVITKEEHRKSITDYLKQNPADHISFFFVDIPKIYKKIFPKGIFYSGRLNIWHRRAVRLARDMCSQKKIDIIHQITPIEFRSIGNYGKIQNVKFVCGPLGGGEFLPAGLRPYARRHIAIELIRTGLNKWYKLVLKNTRKMDNCDCILYANMETMAYLKDTVHGDIPQVLCFDNGFALEELV